jgi:hypothetical protein
MDESAYEQLPQEQQAAEVLRLQAEDEQRNDQ